MKKIICIVLSMIMTFAFVTSALADDRSSGTKKFDSTSCTKRFVTTNYFTKGSDESWGNVTCKATVQFNTSNPSYNYLLAEPYCKSAEVSLGDPNHVIGGISLFWAISYPMLFNGEQDDYDTLNLRITNPYYPSNHSNTINMESHGKFTAHWS